MFVGSRITRLIYDLRLKRRREYLNSLIKRGLKLGRDVDIVEGFFFDPAHCHLISIGDNCTICPNVRLIAHDASTKKILGYTKMGKIDIRENCFIGDSAIILPGVTIGPNSIIGAGSVVTDNVDPSVVAAGNPARKLFSLDDYIEKIRSLKGTKRIFDEGFLGDALTEEKRKELVHNVGDGIGFII